MRSTAALRELARALGGDVVGGQVCCPGPNHSPRDRSLAVRFAPSMPEGFVVHSHCGDDWGACRDHVLRLLGEPIRISQPRKTPPSRPRSRSPQSWTLQIWRDSIDPHGTLVERYLASRNLKLPDAAARFIRFHAACPWTDDRDVRVRVPAMVALFRTIGGDEPSAIQRTALRGDANKIGRKMLGPVAGCAIKVTCDEDVLLRLGVAEGLESAMSANVLGQGPSWALGSAGAIRNLPVLPGIETLALIAEHDRANEEAREVCAARWYDAGREVLIVEPSNHAHKDLNDVLRRAVR
jgi:putative DNA primase/helicase